MWLRNPIALATAMLVIGMSLSACGFTPLYHGGQRNASVEQMAAIDIARIADRDGHVLHNHLLDMLNPLGRPHDPKYRLHVTLNESKASLGIRQTSDATRANMTITANYHLQSIASGETLFKSRQRSVTSYNILRSNFATMMSERDARKTALRDLAEQIRLRLGIHFSNPPRTAQ